LRSITARGIRRICAAVAGAALIGSGLSAPAAAAPADPDEGQAGRAARTATTWAKPLAGTSAGIEFADATASAKAASLSPHLAEIVREAKRVRTVDIDAAALNPSLAAESVAIELFDDVSITLETTVALSKGAATNGRSSWTYSAGGEGGAAVVTTIGGDMHATLWKGPNRYGIKPLGGGRHLVFEDGRRFPDEARPMGLDGKAAAAPAPAESGTLATTVIDIMVAFDEDAQAMFGSVAAVEAEIIEMVNVSNMTYANSQIDQELALTNSLDLNYTPNATDGTTDDQTYLSKIRNKTDGVVDGLHTTRDANSADLVAVISGLSSACGIGYLPTSGNSAELDAYTLTDGSCAVGNLTFPHEVGHNMCAHHDAANVGGSNPCGAAAHAHFSVADNLRTVMAYANAANGCTTCTRIPYFSNPNVTANGWVTGIAGSRNNSQVMGAHASGIAAYRSSGPAPDACEVTYAISSTWPGNVQVSLTVENLTASTLSGWTSQWTVTANETVYNSWGVTVSRVGTQATATGTGFGASIPPGGSVTVGFQATVTGTPTVPSPVTCDA
jgi:peptidyl-Asp metalloendopeptidase